MTLFNGTVSENIARMALVPDAKAVIAAAKSANAHDVIVTLPQGYDTILSGAENQLSVSARQRITLGAPSRDPVLLIHTSDKPRSRRGSEALNLAVRQFKAAGKAVIIMTHRPLAIAECDLLMVVEGGVVVAFGPRDEVMEKTLMNAPTVQHTLRSREAS